MAALIIKSRADDSELQRIDLAGKSESQIAHIESGLAINFDFERFYWTEEKDDPSPSLSTR